VASNTTCRPAPQLPLPCDKVIGPEPPKYGAGYRLGDVFLSRDSWNLSAWHLTNWPNSLASMYIRACGTKGNLAVLSDCVHRKYAKEDNKRINQTATDVVIHLRLGDVLDDKVRRKIPLAEYLRDWVEWWPGTGLYYVAPISAYTRLKIPKDTQRVVLMGNPYFGVGKNCPRSLGYVRAVAKKLQRIHPGLEIAIRFPPPPGSRLRRTLGEAELADRDIYFVQSRAAVFVASKGGFSYLLAKIAISAGHKVEWHVRYYRVVDYWSQCFNDSECRERKPGAQTRDECITSECDRHGAWSGRFESCGLGRFKGHCVKKAFWSDCYSDIGCRVNLGMAKSRDDCIDAECRKRGARYTGRHWKPCGMGKYRGFCEPKDS